MISTKISSAACGLHQFWTCSNSDKHGGTFSPWPPYLGAPFVWLSLFPPYTLSSAFLSFTIERSRQGSACMNTTEPSHIPTYYFSLFLPSFTSEAKAAFQSKNTSRGVLDTVNRALMQNYKIKHDFVLKAHHKVLVFQNCAVTHLRGSYSASSSTVTGARSVCWHTTVW